MAKKSTTKKSATKKKAKRATKRPVKRAVKRTIKRTAKKTAKRKTVRRKVPARKAATGSDREALVSIIAAGTACSKSNANETLNAVLGCLAASIKRNKKVQLVGFGSFHVTSRKARWGVNPATGERIKIKASKSVRFKPSSNLKGSL